MLPPRPEGRGLHAAILMTNGDTGAPLLMLGPLLRYVGETEATIWVETDRACEVEILGHQARTFEVSGHHYALVVIGDLSPGSRAGVPGRPGRRRPLARTGLGVPA